MKEKKLMAHAKEVSGLNRKLETDCLTLLKRKKLLARLKLLYRKISELNLKPVLTKP